MKEICKSHWKEKGGPWECYKAHNFFGWEAERVVAVTTGGYYMLKEATRAKTELILIIAAEGRFKEIIMAAANEGLVDVEDNQIEDKPSCVLCCSMM